MNPSDQIVEINSISHWTDGLISLRTNRPSSFRFESGEFVMLGLHDHKKNPLFRAYSISSPNWADHLEFYSIIVPGGAFTTSLNKLKTGDQLLLRAKPTGTLVLGALLPGKRLIMHATGTGIAPFASIIQDPNTYEAFSTVIVTHTTRYISELGYSQKVIGSAKENIVTSEFCREGLKYFPTVTRQEFENKGRINSLIKSGKMLSKLKINDINPDTDRVMFCGSVEFNRNMKELYINRGFFEGSLNRPGSFVLEKAFVG